VICYNYIPIEFVDDLAILDIVDTFSYKHLDDVYTRLGIEKKDIENAKLEAPNNPKQQAKEVLHLWCNRNPETATKAKMIRAMEQCPDCRAEMNKLKIKCESTGKYLSKNLIFDFGICIINNYRSWPVALPEGVGEQYFDSLVEMVPSVYMVHTRHLVQ
jgi:hypothetical protein